MPQHNDSVVSNPETESAKGLANGSAGEQDVVDSVSELPGALAGYRIGIIISMFPELHETFILRELVALERKGLAFTIYSLQHPRDPITMEDAIRLSENRTRYSSLITPATLGAFAKTALTRPVKVASAIFKLLRHGYDRPTDVVKALAILPITLYFEQQAREEGVTHFHGHWANIPTTACWFLHQIYDYSWSAAIHGEDIFSPNQFLAYKLEDARFAAVCSGLFCRHIQTELNLTRPHDVHLNYHGLDPKVMALSADKVFRQRTDGEPVRLISIGRMVPTKGHDTLIKACADLVRQGVAVSLELIGSGPIESELKQLTEAQGLSDHVEFRGGIAFDEVLEALQRADIFCLAPRMLPGQPPDGIPNVIAEAMALRIPVVTTRVSAIPELIEDGVSGLLVPVDDVDAMATAIASVVKDETFARALSDHGFQKVGTLFDQNKNIDELLDLFSQYLDKASS